MTARVGVEAEVLARLDTHARTTRAHARTRARAHTHTHTHTGMHCACGAIFRPALRRSILDSNR